MSSTRQKTQSQQEQLLLAFAQENRSESPMAYAEGTVLRTANSQTESPTSSDRLMESICDPRNIAKADHRRLRCYLWKQWKTGPRRYTELRRRGVHAQLAAKTAGSRKGPWHLSRSKALQLAIPRASLLALNLPLLYEPEPNV